MSFARLSESDIVTLPLDDLALHILADFAESNGWNWRNWVIQYYGSSTHGSPQRAAVEEAWGWIIAQGLVHIDTGQSSAESVKVSRAGRQALKDGGKLLRASQQLRMPLHSRIDRVVRRQFLLGEVELAAFAAMREVEIRVRELGKYQDGDIGTGLMRKAFHPETGPLTDLNAEKGEREAVGALFAGAVGAFKNPNSHRTVNYTDPLFAADIVMFADALLRMLDTIADRL